MDLGRRGEIAVTGLDLVDFCVGGVVEDPESEGCNRCYEHEDDECDWCDECGPTAKVDNWLQELLDKYHQLLRQQGCLIYTGRILDDYPLEDSDDSI